MTRSLRDVNVEKFVRVATVDNVLGIARRVRGNSGSLVGNQTVCAEGVDRRQPDGDPALPRHDQFPVHDTRRGRAGGGFPALSLTGEFLLKDIPLLGLSFWTLSDAIKAARPAGGQQ